MPRTTTVECLDCPPLRALTFDALGLIKVIEARTKEGGVPKVNYYEAYHAVSIAGHCATACNDVCNEGGLTMFQQHNNEIYVFTSVVQSLLIKLVPVDQL
ncbi:WD repeat-containing protein 74 [Corchorus olitorius]|uniref:WD repeat-containing protein 74 n=1 Tax=Corchorus olitorius TaxID=93759 RepID=A0A1R3GAT0_9ROSI|nr:WD repeat-containing protein 74 [Corchorus olitorius]